MITAGGKSCWSTGRSPESMAAVVVSALGKRCLLVLDAYFAVGPVFAILRQVRDDAGGGILELSKPCIDRILYFYPSQKNNPRLIEFDKRGF
jgi:hypothetical protein